MVPGPSLSPPLLTRAGQLFFEPVGEFAQFLHGHREEVFRPR